MKPATKLFLKNKDLRLNYENDDLSGNPKKPSSRFLIEQYSKLKVAADSSKPKSKPRRSMDLINIGMLSQKTFFSQKTLRSGEATTNQTTGTNFYTRTVQTPIPGESSISKEVGSSIN